MSREPLRLLLLSLVVIVAAQPTKQNDVEEDDQCVLQASLVLHELKNCGMAKHYSPADSARSNSDLTNMVEKMTETLENIQKQLQQNADTNKIIKDCLKDMHHRITGTNIIYVSGMTFHYSKTRKMFWRQAHDYCEKKGMKMASLKTASEINAATKELKKQGNDVDHFWLSASDTGRKPGDFKWEDGTPVDDSTWYIGNPNDFKAGRNTCVYLAPGESTIYDVDCEAAGPLGPYALCLIPPASCF